MANLIKTFNDVKIYPTFATLPTPSTMQPLSSGENLALSLAKIANWYDLGFGISDKVIIAEGTSNGYIKYSTDGGTNYTQVAVHGLNTMAYEAKTNYIPTSQKGAANGVATLGADSKIPSSQLPSYVDDVIEGYYYNSKFYAESTHTTEITPESGKIYIDITNPQKSKSYRWSGTAYFEIAEVPDIFSGSTPGLVPDATSASNGAYLNKDGTWTIPAATTANALTLQTNGTASGWTFDGSAAKTLNFKNGTDISITGDSSGNITITHSNANVTAVTTNSFLKIKYDSKGHITGSTAVVKSDITGLGIPDTDSYVTAAAFAYDSTNHNQKLTLTRNNSLAALTANIPIFTGASTSAAGKSGLVPDAATSSCNASYVVASTNPNGANSFLRSDGAWSNQPVIEGDVLVLNCIAG